MRAAVRFKKRVRTENEYAARKAKQCVVSQAHGASEHQKVDKRRNGKHIYR